MSKAKYYYVFRSAVTGKFVSKAFAECNPKTTYKVRRLR